jgi:Kef-type K+ transport system membrane component KefB
MSSPPPAPNGPLVLVTKGLPQALKNEDMGSFLHLFVLLLVLVVCARIAATLGKFLGLPSFVLQLLAGILLGPSVLDLLGGAVILGNWGSPSSDPAHAVVKALAEIGLIQLMFLAGLQMDWLKLKTTIRPAFSLGLWGFAFSGVFVALASRPFVSRWPEALMLSSILAASSFGIAVHALSQMNLLHLRATTIILGGSSVATSLALLLMTASLAADYALVFGPFRMGVAVSWFLGKIIMFFAVSYFLFSRFLRLSGRKGLQQRPLQMLIGYLLLLAALYAWAALHFGGFVAIGVPSLGGVLLSLSHTELKEKVKRGLSSFLSSLFIGLFFVVLGMGANFREPGLNVTLLAVLLAACVGGKEMGSWLGTRRYFPSGDERALTMRGTLHPGEAGILIATYGFSRGLLNPSQFNLAIAVVLILTILAPLLMKITVPASAFLKNGPGYQT